ncbi:hypothetical protein [Streptomyces sp. ADI98-10]|uniref:hypothetical protein n=1 Tax=Streptomyces sp. ADI98-10 TaxID=1522763 RepID=UPI000F5552C1|nr:hypothetical protein [Streptomyces sp. ADI98-10]RPK81025.1 hypothetical protein EES46_29950 [Streptomyces sp. ADI98-10]
MDRAPPTPLYAHQGPRATVYLDTSFADEATLSRRELKARQISEDLAGRGADQETCPAVRRAIAGPGPEQSAPRRTDARAFGEREPFAVRAGDALLSSAVPTGAEAVVVGTQARLRSPPKTSRRTIGETRPPERPSRSAATGLCCAGRPTGSSSRRNQAPDRDAGRAAGRARSDTEQP